MARSDQTAWLVTVLEGPAAGATIPLTGRALPYRGGAGGNVSFGWVQRSKLTWYPGSRVADQQIIGPVILPTTINGVWKERYLGEDQPIELAELFEELSQQGAQVRVEWQTIERQGIVKQVSWVPGDPTGGLTDIRWEIVFEWNSDPSQARPPARLGSGGLAIRDSLTNAAAAIGTLSTLVSNFIDANRAFVGTVKSSFQRFERGLTDLIDEYRQPLQALSEAASQSGVQPSLYARIAEGASTGAASAQLTSGAIAESTAGIFPGAVLTDDTLESRMALFISQADILDQSYSTAEEQFEARQQLEQIIRPDEYAVIAAVAGSDLREYAVRYYGNSDLWPRIAKLNGLETSVIPADLEELVIPLSLPDTADDRVGAC